MTMIHLDLCCNDDSGDFTGELHAAEFRDCADALLLSLQWGGGGDGLAFAWVVGRLSFPDSAHFEVSGREKWAGNMYWDATSIMGNDKAEEFATYLLKSGFTVLEAVSGDPVWSEFWRHEQTARRAKEAGR